HSVFQLFAQIRHNFVAGVNDFHPGTFSILRQLSQITDQGLNIAAQLSQALESRDGVKCQLRFSVVKLQHADRLLLRGFTKTHGQGRDAVDYMFLSAYSLWYMQVSKRDVIQKVRKYVHAHMCQGSHIKITDTVI